MLSCRPLVAFSACAVAPWMTAIWADGPLLLEDLLDDLGFEGDGVAFPHAVIIHPILPSYSV